jgi:hypothetical protein
MVQIIGLHDRTDGAILKTVPNGKRSAPGFGLSPHKSEQLPYVPIASGRDAVSHILSCYRFELRLFATRIIILPAEAFAFVIALR